MQYLTLYSKKDVLSLTRIRRFETKIGEVVQVIHDTAKWEDALAASTAKYVIVGVPEELGVKANYEKGGTHTAWIPFLEAFLNIQSNDFLQGDDVLVLGHLNFNDIANLIHQNTSDSEEKVTAYRHALNEVDNAVEHLIKIITQNKKIPIVIGGGHNNAYGCIKGAAKGLHKAGLTAIAQVNVINLDDGADFSPMDGRHNNNGFRYADEDGYLDKYCIIGLHENYLPQNIWMDIVNDPFIDVITYEDIFLHEKRTVMQAIAHAATFTEDNFCGIEVSMSAIQHALSSAETPVGVHAHHARQIVYYAARDSKPAYLHVCEGITVREDGIKNDATGKLISYLVSDFIKALQIQ